MPESQWDGRSMGFRGFGTWRRRSGAPPDAGKRGTRYGLGPRGSGLSYSELLALRETQAAARPPGAWRPKTRKGLFIALAAVALALLLGLAIWFLLSAAPEPAKPPPPAALVNANHLNCRAQPSPTSQVVRVAGRGEKLLLHEPNGPWRRVTLQGATCWVSSAYLQPTGH